MSKKKIAAQNKGKKNRRRARGRRLKIAVLILLATLGIGTVAGPWRESLGVKRLRALIVAPVPPPPPPSNPSKEYIYAGGRLIATEAAGASLAAPAGLVATTLSNLPQPQVTITWQPTTGADHYEVERTTNITTPYTPVNSNVTTTTFTDTSVTSVTAYLYRVRAVDQFGSVSAYSGSDLATAISFTDDTLYVQSTLVRAAHINELRQSVDAVRALVNLDAVNWGGSVQANSTEIRAVHIQDLRVNLDPARNALGLSGCSYTDNSIAALQASFIKKEHIDQLRQCVK